MTEPTDQTFFSNSIWKTVLRYGGFLGAINIALSLVYYLMDVDFLSLQSAEIILWISGIIALVMMYLGMKHQRDNWDDGYISFKKAFIVGALILAFGTLIDWSWSFIFTHIIDPNYIEHYNTKVEDHILDTWKGHPPQPEVYSQNHQGTLGWQAAFGQMKYLLMLLVSIPALLVYSHRKPSED